MADTTDSGLFAFTGSLRVNERAKKNGKITLGAIVAALTIVGFVLAFMNGLFGIGGRAALARRELGTNTKRITVVERKIDENIDPRIRVLEVEFAGAKADRTAMMKQLDRIENKLP